MYIIFCISIKCLIIPLALELTNSGSKCHMSPTVGGTYNVGSKWPPSMCRNTFHV